MVEKIQRVKGMYDLLPAETARWHRVERAACKLLQQYGYRELRLPLLERTALFAGAIGESTDVVAKEMYAFEDRNGDHLALRPEGTAGCVRAMIQNGLLHNHLSKVWYAGPMFRRENVQKGRNRQFYQIGAEAFGVAGPDVDAELILLLARLWQALGLTGLRLELNSLGSGQSRAAYREQLVAYFERHRQQLDADSARRLELNPLRILDSKNPAMAELVAQAPSLLDHLDDESATHFEQLREILDAAGIDYVINPRLVRGLDYYSRTVFEWITTELGAQGTVCAGGRYDGLVAAQGGAETPAIGFAMGVDRLVELLRAQGDLTAPQAPDVFVIAFGDAATASGLVLAESLREQLPGIHIDNNFGGGSFKAQFKRADKSGASFALIVGEQELADQTVGLKPLRERAEQQTVERGDVAQTLSALLSTGD